MARVIPQQQQQQQITPQARQQMSQTLDAMTRTLQNISAGIGAATPAQRTQIAGVLGAMRTTLGQAQAQTAPAIQRVPDTPPVVPPTPTPAQMQEEKMRALMREHEVALRAPTPEPVGLQPQERQLFTDERANLRARYDTALQTLRRQQEQDRARLVGRYAAAGFTEPGIIAGPMAGEPGIVTRALQETGEVHARNIAGLEQGGAQDILAITRAEQEAERRGRVEAAEQFARRQDALVRNLERQMELARPEEFTLGGRIFQRDRATGATTDITPQIPTEPVEFTLGGRMFQRDPVTGVTTDITPPTALHQQVNIERGGRRLRVTFDDRGREVGAIDLGPVDSPQDETLTPSQARDWNVPFGTTEGQLKDIYESPTPPQWFVNRKQREAAVNRMSYTPRKIQELWNAERARVIAVDPADPPQDGRLPGEDDL